MTKKEEKPKCPKCGREMRFIRKEENAPFDEFSVYDFTEWLCLYCERFQIYGFPPVPID